MGSPYPPAIKKLIETFTRLPSIGPKTAERLVFYLLKKPEKEIQEFIDNLTQVKNQIQKCELCNNFSPANPCHICRDKNRDHSLLCIVAENQDLQAIEKTNNFNGVYFVLNGYLEPLKGTGPMDIKIPELLNRIKKSSIPIKEIILALDADINGETTILYLTKILKPLKIKITRLARGLPVGADLEYADEITLTEALKNRREIQSDT